MLATAAIAAGAIREDVEPVDILPSLTGWSLATADAAQRDRLLDLLMNGPRDSSH